MQYRDYQHGKLDLDPQNMKPAMLAQENHQFCTKLP